MQKENSNEINEFLNKLINEQPHNHPINFSFLQRELKKQFLIELDGKTINSFLSFFTQKNKYIEIKKANYTELVIGLKKEKIDDFLDSLFQNKEFGFQLEISEIRSLFKNQTTYDLPDESINNYLFRHPNIEKKLSPSNTTVLSISPTIKEMNEFLNTLINEQRHDQPIQISFLQQEFTKKFLRELDNNTINNFILFFAQKNKDIEIKRANYTELIVGPKKELIDGYLTTLFNNKQFYYQIEISEIKKYFKEQTTYDLPDESINKYLFEHKNIGKKQSLENTTVLFILPVENDILDFIESFFTPGVYKKVFASDITDSFKQKFNIPFPDNYLSDSYLSHRRIKLEIDDNYTKSLCLIPPYNEIEDFLKYIFFNYGYLYKEISRNEINSEYHKRFASNLDEDVLDTFLSHFPNIQLIHTGRNNRLYRVNPTEEELDYILTQYIKQGDEKKLLTFTFEEIKLFLQNKHNFTLNKDVFIKWIENIKNKKDLAEVEVEILPNNIFIRRPAMIEGQHIQSIFDKSLPHLINKSLSISIIQEFNNTLSQYCLIIRKKRNSNEIILTYENTKALDVILNELSIPIRKRFLEEIVGYSLIPTEMKDLYKQYTGLCSKYDIELDDGFYTKLADKANKELLDIKIVYNTYTDKLYSEFKFNTKNSFSTDGEIECPVCKNKHTQKNILSHILISHTSSQKNMSILTRDSSNTFYCHHCKNKMLKLYEASYVATIYHLIGECKKGENKTRNMLLTNMISFDRETGVWKGFAYSNNSETLGNSGQLLRDNGRFGSFPSEDYYGDGDSNF